MESILSSQMDSSDAANLRASIIAASENAAKHIQELRKLAIRCRELADIDYGFLYDKDRHLLSIGYNVADRRLDGGFYDLLASEARGWPASSPSPRRNCRRNTGLIWAGHSTNTGREPRALLERLDV